jgi:hypothetical protein
MQINKMTTETLNYIASCANEVEHASVRKLSCADVRGLLAEHAALVAVAEAAKQYAAVCNDWNLATLENALANLAAVREGGAK